MHAEDIDYDALSADLLRALRGRRSQTAFSRRLGYRSNVAYTWESGRRWPTASVTLRAAERTGVDVRAFLRTFLAGEGAWSQSPSSSEGVASLLRALRADTPVVELARRVGRSRFAVSRWLKGEAEPRLPDFLRLIEGSSLRLLDFVAGFADPSELPSTKRRWSDLEAARRLARESPWGPAVFLALQLEGYRAQRRHVPGWIAQAIGVPLEVEERCLELLASARQIRKVRGRWQVADLGSVDTRQARSGTELKQFWGQVGLDRLEAGADGVFSFNLFTVSDADYQRIGELQRAYYRSLRAIVADSAPAERLVLTNLHLVPLDGGQGKS